MGTISFPPGSITRNSVPGTISDPSYGAITTEIIGEIIADSKAYYNPSILSSLYQDAAGTTPVTADDDPVGLMLDNRFGLVRGSEEVSNGDFSSGTTGWSIIAAGGATQDVVSGELQVTTSTGGTGSVQTLSLTVGEWYEATAYIRKISGSSFVELAALNNAENVFVARGKQITSSTATSVTTIFRATETNNKIYCRVNANGDVGGFDNISVKSLAGNHAVQTTADSRPVYKTDGTYHWLQPDGIDDFMTIPGSASTLKFMHTGDGGTFAAAVQFGLAADPDARYALASSFYQLADIGFWINWDDRAAQSANERPRYLAANGSVAVVDVFPANGSFPANSPAVIRTSYSTQSGKDGAMWRNSALLEEVDQSATPNTADSTADVRLFRSALGTDPMPGKFYGGLFIDKILSSSQATQLDRFLARLGGVSL